MYFCYKTILITKQVRFWYIITDIKHFQSYFEFALIHNQS